MKPVSATVLILLLGLLLAGWMFYSNTQEPAPPIPQEVENRETRASERDQSPADEGIERFEADARKIGPSIDKGADATLDDPAQ